MANMQPHTCTSAAPGRHVQESSNGVDGSLRSLSAISLCLVMCSDVGTGVFGDDIIGDDIIMFATRPPPRNKVCHERERIPVVAIPME